MEATLELRKVEVLPNGERVVVTEADIAHGIPKLVEHNTLVKRKDGVDTRIPIKYYYICRDSEVQHFIDWRNSLPTNARGFRELGWDTETSGVDAQKDKIATEQQGTPLGPDPRVYVADVRCLSKPMVELYMSAVNDPSYIKVGQNLGFECKFGMHHLKLRPQRLYCTQITELVLRAGLFEGGKGGKGSGGDEGGSRRAYSQTSMSKLVRRYCGNFDLDKDPELRMSFYKTPPGTHNPRQIVYAGSDCVHPFFIREGQVPEIDSRALRSVLSIEYELIAVLVEMELRGMAFDSEGWVQLWQQAVVRHEIAERKLDQLFLGIEPDLFAGTNAAESPRKVCDICLGEGLRTVVTGVRQFKKQVECDQCGGTGRIGGGVRPIYTGGQGKNSRPRPLNWGSSAQVKWAIRQYCAKTGWRHELLSTEAQLRKAKRLNGVPWLIKKGVIKFDTDGNANVKVEDLPDDVIDGIPDYVLAEERYCILLSTDADVIKLRMLRSQLPRELCELLLEYGEEKAKLGTFGRKFLNNVHDDGRVRFEFHQAIAATGRLSASPNSMNIPREKAYRHSFRAGKGKKLCIADYSQQEPRTSAFVSRDELFLKNYAEGADLYITVAEAMLGYRPDPKFAEKKGEAATPEDHEFEQKSKDDRQAIKSTSLGLNYRMGAGKLRDKLTLDTNRPWTFFDAADLHKQYLEQCSGIKDYQELCFRLADPNNPQATRIWDIMIDAPVTFIESPCGRKRFFPPDSKSVYTEACNHPIQGCGATMTKAAMVMISKEIVKRGWYDRAYLVNAIHDELVMEADEDIAPEVAKMMKECMERAGAYYLKDVPIKASFPTPDGTADKWVKD